MKQKLRILPLAFLIVLWLTGMQQAFGQASACPQVNAGPDVTICGGCTTLTATVQGTNGTGSYTASPIPYNPYPFTGGNPVLVNIDDTWTGALTLPFCFEFYGNTYNQYIIGSNALITFDMTQAGGFCDWVINGAIPNASSYDNVIMAPYHDIDPSVTPPSGVTDINWQIYGTSPCREMVVNWTNIPMFSCNSVVATSQAVLHETTNIIDIYIQNKPLCNSWNSGAAVEGIVDATGANSTIVPGRNFPTQWTAANDGYRFMPSGAPNYTVQWIDQNNNVVGTGLSVTVCPSQTTTYTAVVTNTSCAGPITVSDQVTVTVSSGGLSATPASVNPTCANPCGGSATVTPNGGTPPYTYAWAPSGGNTATANGLCAGTYTCTITEAGGCQTQVTFNLTQPPVFTNSMASTTASCGNNNGSATVTTNGGTGPFTYSWAPSGGNAATANNLAPGNYTVTVTDANGCVVTSTVAVGNTGMSVTNTAQVPLCNGDCNGSATVSPTNGTPPYNYLWAPSGNTGATETGLCAGTYTCTITDGAGCVSTQSITLTQPTAVTATVTNATTCPGNPATITISPSGGTGPYTVTWSNSLPNGTSQTVSPQATTTYTATVTDANGCTSVQTLTVTVQPPPTAQFTPPLGECAPYPASFINNSVGGTTYQWDFGDPLSGINNISTQQNPTHTYNTGGSYNVTLIVTDASGCSDTLTINSAVTILAQPVAGLNANSTVVSEFAPDIGFTDVSSGGNNCVIYFGDGDSLVGCNQGAFTHTYQQPGIYTVTQIIVNGDGCTDTLTFTVVVEQETSLYVPNAFTPNGSTVNDIFYAYGTNVKTFQMYLFDRWGNLIFQTSDLNTGWDGKYKGNDCQQDVYVWRIIYTDGHDKKHKLMGHVTLLR